VNENIMVGTAIIPPGMRRSLTNSLGPIGKSQAVTRTVSDGTQSESEQRGGGSSMRQPHVKTFPGGSDPGTEPGPLPRY
jgi:hypothetical protein